MKRILAAAGAALALASAAPAFAADFILSSADGNINPTFNPKYLNFGIDLISSTPTHIDAFIRNTVPSGPFSDNYFFAVETFEFLGSGSATTNNSAFLTLADPAGVTITRYILTPAILAALDSAFTASNYNTELGIIQSYVAGNPTAPFASSDGTGTTQLLDNVPLVDTYLYKITVAGTASSASPYSGNLSANAVPEPATWAMMLAGFGLVGFAMRRQRQSHPKVRFAF